MRVCIVSATEIEIAPLKKFLEEKFASTQLYSFHRGDVQVDLLITGVGILQTAYSLTKYLQLVEADLCINAGIAGALNSTFEIGNVYQVIEDQVFDLGTSHPDGSFENAFSMGLMDKNSPPFSNGKLQNKSSATINFLPSATAITVNKVHGDESSISNLRKYCDADLESMEGAAFFYCCIMEKINCLQVRSVSNYLEPRNKDNWDIPQAIKNLNKVLIEMIEVLTS